MAKMRLLSRVLVSIVLLISLTFNLISFSIDFVSDKIISKIEAASGFETVSSRNSKKIANLNREIALTKKANSILASEVGTLKNKIKSLDLELAKSNKARQEFVRRANVSREKAMTVTKSVKSRTVKLATESVSSVAGQALPWVGAAIVAAATAYELKMACETMKDMDELEGEFSELHQEDKDVGKICGIEPPGVDAIWQSIKASPSVVWDTAGDVVKDLGEFPYASWAVMVDSRWWEFWRPNIPSPSQHP
jgi:septal ring factor EnvC (AmiA/AmiB activator)